MNTARMIKCTHLLLFWLPIIFFFTTTVHATPLPLSNESFEALSSVVTSSEDNNGLLNDLVAFWKCDEASGNAVDTHINGLDLTASNVTSDTGWTYPLARSFLSKGVSQGNSYLIRPEDDELLSVGDNDYTIAAWVYLSEKTTINRIVYKYEFSPAGAEMQLYQTSDKYSFYLKTAENTSAGLVTSDSYGAVPLDEWMLIVAWHDAAHGRVCIQINNGAIDCVDRTGIPNNGNQPFKIGHTQYSWLGKIGPIMVWKSTPGYGGVLTTSQKTALYDTGSGLTYDQFDTDSAPHLSVIPISPDLISDSTPDITGTASDILGTVSLVEFQVDKTSGSWTSCIADDGAFDEASEDFTCSMSTPLSDNRHTVFIRATDSSSNTTPIGFYSSVTFAVDATPPSFPINQVNGITTITPGSTITLDTSRPTFLGTTEPFTQIKIFIYSAPISGETETNERGDWEWTPEEDILAGTHRVVVTMRDLAGNESEWEFTLVVELADTGTQVLTSYLVGTLLLAGISLSSFCKRKLSV